MVTSLQRVKLRSWKFTLTVQGQYELDKTIFLSVLSKTFQFCISQFTKTHRMYMWEPKIPENFVRTAILHNVEYM